MSNTFVVRDRRKPRRFSIDNIVMDDWLPLLGAVGFGFYALLSRLARMGEEKSFPGYSLISEHLGVSRSTVAAYVRFLQLSELVHVVSGNSRRSNTYYLLEPRPVTDEVLAELAAGVAAAWPEDNSFRRTFERRLASWSPLRSRFRGGFGGDGNDSGLVQGSLPGVLGSSPGEPGSSPGVLGSSPGEPGSSPGVLGSSPGELGSSPGELGSSPGVLEQTVVNKPKSTNRSQQTVGVVVDDTLAGEVFILGNSQRARVDHHELDAAFDAAGIVGESTRRSIVDAWPGVSAADLRAWARYRESDHGRGMGIGAIVDYLRRGVAAPREFYDDSRDYSITIYE